MRRLYVPGVVDIGPPLPYWLREADEEDEQPLLKVKERRCKPSRLGDLRGRRWRWTPMLSWSVEEHAVRNKITATESVKAMLSDMSPGYTGLVGLKSGPICLTTR